jgi:cytidylate kinase
MKPVVTLAALYGAGGSVVGRQVAERLDVPFLDRAIPEAAAERIGLPKEAVAGVDDAPRSRLERVASVVGRASTMTGGAGGSLERLDLYESRVRAYIEAALAGAAETGGVVVGRGGMIVLRDLASALHVNLRGPVEARVRQGMEIEGVDRATAERRQKEEDKSRIDYVRRAYGVEGDDPSYYHMVLDSTALGLDLCVELVVAAAQERVRRHRTATSG